MNAARTVFIVLAFAGWALWFRSDRLSASMVMLWILGLVAALPLGWRDVGTRGYVIAVPAVVCCLSLPFAAGRWLRARPFRPGPAAVPLSLMVAAVCLGVTLSIGVASFCVRALRQPRAAEDVVVDPSKDPVVFVSDDPHAMSDPFGPMTMRREDLLHAMAAYNIHGYADYLAQIPVPFVIASPRHCDQMLVVQGADDSAPIEIDTTVPSPNRYFRRADSWHAVEQPARP